VHESFYLCLSLGFKGRFGGSPKLEKQRRSYMEQLATDISAARGATGALSQHVAAVGSIVPEAPRRSLWRLPLMAMAIFVVAVVILNILVHCLASKAITVFA